MKKLTVTNKQNILLVTLLEGEEKNPQGYAIFGIEKEVVKPLIKLGWLHDKTYKYTGGAKLTTIGRQIAKGKELENRVANLEADKEVNPYLLTGDELKRMEEKAKQY